MRNYKFRYFDKQDGTMNDFQGMPMLIEELESVGDRDGMAVMQYTGLKDYHGADIYEDDILFRQRTHRHKNGTRGKVEFKNSTWVLTDEDGTSPLSDFNFNTEVIGNLHQHPHLLEVSTE